MSRNWSLFLVVAFVLGFGTKTYLDSLDKPADVSKT
ncbi:SCO family protein, partial [Vibrio alginolyticus]|nr:SCO family protein [Vibrio alginolyticus]MDW2183919.1 SCO family protein [Vibrio sp. 1762]